MVGAFYLTDFIGSGTDEDAFRARSADLFPKTGLIDLRPDSTQQAGLCLLGVTERNDRPGMEYLGADVNDTLPAGLILRLQNRLNIGSLTSTTIKQLLMELLDPLHPFAWKPIRPARLAWDFHLGGELVLRIPRIAGGVQLAASSFTGSDENPISEGGVWTGGYGKDAQRVGNEVQSTSAANGFPALGAYTAVSFPNDQWSQVRLSTWNTGTAGAIIIGANVRFANSPTATVYDFEALAGSTGGDTSRFNKRVNSARTQLAQETATSWVANDTVYTEAIGTSLAGNRNGGSNLLSASDGDIASGYAGFQLAPSGGAVIGDCALDDIKMGDFMPQIEPWPHRGGQAGVVTQ